MLNPEDTTGYRRAHALVHNHLTELHGDVSPNRLPEAAAEVLVDLAGRKRSLVAIATVDDQGAGVAVLFPEPRGSSLRVVHVVPDHRRRGIGTALLRLLLDEAVCHGRYPVSAVADQHRPATALAASLGVFPLAVGEPGRLRFELRAPHHFTTQIAAARS